MKSLLLSGFGIIISVDGRKLIINKRQDNEKIAFHPHQIAYDNVIIDGNYGSISFEALRWLSKHGITLSLLNWNGNLLSVTLPKEPISGRLKMKQYEAYMDEIKRYRIAEEIILTKINKSRELLTMLSNYYKELDKEEINKIFSRESENLMRKENKTEYNNNKTENPENKTEADNVIGFLKQNKTEQNNEKTENNINKTESYNSKQMTKLKENRIKTDKNREILRNFNKITLSDNENFKNYNTINLKKELNLIMTFEGRIADYYWKELSKIFNELYPEFNFKSRKNKSYSWNMNASDYVNALLNYGYAILESVIRKYINVIGLDPNIGFLHEINDSKTPLVYDLQELYRWLIDLSVIQLLEDKKIKKSDFIVTENYNIRLRERGICYLLEKITLNLNKRAEYKGKFHTFDNILLDNVRKLGDFIEKGKTELKFDIPDIKINRTDNVELRNQIMEITPEERNKLGINKSTLWYRQKAIKEGKGIKIYNKFKPH